MILPSDLAGGTTRTVGLFEVDAGALVRWVAHSIGERQYGFLPTATLVDCLSEIPRKEDARDPRRDLVVPLGGWCALLNNGIRGTDVGPLPWKAPTKLGCRAIRAISSEASENPATMLEVYDPASQHPLFRRRLLYAMSDRGRWSFDAEGEPFDFEETENYSKRRIRDRFTPEMLERYLIALGVPMLESAEEPIDGAILVAKQL